MTHIGPRDHALTLVRLADELRALSNAGIHFTEDPYQIERYHRIIGIAAELTSLSTAQSVEEIHTIALEDMRYMTPYSTVETAIFDEQGRILLIQRADSGLWALPGGACDVGEAPSTGARREAWEETGCVVEIEGLVGVFDTRLSNEAVWHQLYIFLFSARIREGQPMRTRETRDVRWFAPHEIPYDHLHGRHNQRIEYALRWHTDPAPAVYYDLEGWHPEPTFHHLDDSGV